MGEAAEGRRGAFSASRTLGIALQTLSRRGERGAQAIAWEGEGVTPPTGVPARRLRSLTPQPTCFAGCLLPPGRRNRSRTGIEQRGSPAFVEKNPTNSTPYNFLSQFNQTRQISPHNQSRPRHGEGSWYRPKRGEDRIERGRKKVSGRRDRVCSWIDPGPCEPFLDKLAGRQGRDRQTGLTGSAEAAAGSPRGYWSCPSVGQPGPGLKQHPRLRPSGITTRRSGRRSRNAKQTHGPRAPPGRSAPPRPNA